MKKLRLYIVSHLGDNPCWRLVVAENAADAFLKCVEARKMPQKASMCNCTVNELKINGYEITIAEKKEQ
jgi:hypothetical protein